MHLSAHDKARAFVDIYLDKATPLSILDVGSRVVSEQSLSHKSLLNNPKWQYTGLDLEAGKNVDIVLGNPYKWGMIKDNSYDVIMCGQVFEHVEYFWLTMKEIARVLKDGGLVFITAPASGPEHKFPYDCWRFYPDGWKALCKWSGLTDIEVYTQWEPLYYPDGSDKWQDSCLIAWRPTTGLMVSKDTFRQYERARLSAVTRRELFSYNRKRISYHFRMFVWHFIHTINRS